MHNLLSATQVSMWRECPRKWAWRYIAKLKPPPTKAQELGTEVDEGQLQPYLRDGRALDFSKPSGEIAQCALAHLPGPQAPGVIVQHRFELPSATGLPFAYLGFKDVYVRESFEIIDFKTTADFKWRKTPEELRRDPQAILYATNAAFEGAEYVRLKWLYLRTKGKPKCEPVEVTLHREELVAPFEAIDATGVEIYKAAIAAPNPKDLPANPRACDAYGGCPYRANCNLTPKERLDAIPMTQTSLFERLAAKAAPSPSVPATAEPVSPSVLADPEPASPSVPATAEPASPSVLADPEPAVAINPPESVIDVASLPPNLKAEVPRVSEVPDTAPTAAKRGRPPGAKNLPKKEEEYAPSDTLAVEFETGGAVKYTYMTSIRKGESVHALRDRVEAFVRSMSDAWECG